MVRSSRARSVPGSPLSVRALAGVLLFAAVACTNPSPTRPVAGTESGESLLLRAQRESREGQHAAAARTYEDLAQQSRGRLQDGLQLRAAAEWLRADDPARAEAMLTAAGTSPAAEDAALRSQVVAELALRNRRPQDALAELDRITTSQSGGSAAKVLELRSRALFDLNQAPAAVAVAIERESLLAAPEELRANRRLIWEGLQRTAATEAPANAPPTLAGWLALQDAALAAERNPFTARATLDAWRSRYPNHPAGQFITQEVVPSLGAGLDYPPQVALLLPLTGRQQAAGIAVRDGFLAALLQQDSASRPTVNIYDSAALGAANAYTQAVNDGAQFVVGPLTKEEVQAVAESGNVSLPTLSLNYLPENALAPGLLYQFALDPEDEARQVARRAIADGRTHGVALLPDNEWGQRLLRAFEAEFSVAGGTLVGRNFYDPAARDYSQPITRLLLIDQSRARANALSTALGSRFEFEPRARSDVQFVFIGAQPLQGRSLRPALRFHLSQDLPVYATSDVFEPDSNANGDLDGVIFPDMPWVISPDAQANDLRGALTSYWPGRSRGRGRLYAFGYDAFRMIPVLRSSQPTTTPLGGLTGRLLVDDRGRVRRELNWAQVENGRPRPLAVISTGMTGL